MSPNINIETNEPGPEIPQELGGMKLHMGVAEQGKLFALEGNHSMALLYYRSAMHMCVQSGDPEVFFRLYLEAALESMEIQGYHEEVLTYTTQAIQLYEDKPPTSEIARIDLAYIYQKRGVILMKMGQKEEAKAAFQTAVERIKQENGRLPLAETCLRWLQIGYHLDPKRILAEQQKSKYFTVRQDNVNAEIAIRLPDEQLMPMG